MPAKPRFFSFATRRRTPPGSTPGLLLADPGAPPPRLSLTGYAPEALEEVPLDDAGGLRARLDRHAVTWVDVQGLGDVELIRQLGEIFGLHSLALEDVLNVHQRPKVEAFDDHLFIVLRMPAQGPGIDTEQVAMFVGERYVLTFQERHGDCFGAVRERIRRDGSRLRASGTDYLAYALLDAAVDAFFPVLEALGETLGSLEEAVTGHGPSVPVARIHSLKRDLLALRRTLWPIREMTGALLRDDSRFISPRTRLYLRDCYDHAVQLMDIVETQREIAASLVDIHLSSVSARMNEVMKVLTVIATIFIPLSFVASVYGMNFDPAASPWNMPELGWYWGYPYALGIMLAVALVLLGYFWRKGWLGARAAHD